VDFRISGTMILPGREAQTHLEAAVKLNTTDPIAHRTLADVYYGQGSFAQARPPYEKAVKANPKDPELNRNLGNVLFHAKEYDQAVVYFNKALDITGLAGSLDEPRDLLLSPEASWRGRHDSEAQSGLKSQSSRSASGAGRYRALAGKKF
jgi:tetratricopeptide (TPR) repeat protein